MAAIFWVLAAACAVASAAPPSSPRLYQQQTLQQINPLDYYLDNQEVANYYQQAQQQKQGNAGGNGAPARLENLEPDSEVELIPGAQQPQQPPQQSPVNPNLPGLAPGQRVFIVHMPVAGYRPGTIGGYQPVYIVGAGGQGATGVPGYSANGFQNAVLLDPSGQAVISPLGYRPAAIGPQGFAIQGVPQGLQGGNPGLVFGAPLLNRPYDLVYQDPALQYQSVQGVQGVDGRAPAGFSQLVNAQGQNGPSGPRPAANEESVNSQPSRQSESVESKEKTESRNARPSPPHAQRVKA